MTNKWKLFFATVLLCSVAAWAQGSAGGGAAAGGQGSVGTGAASSAHGQSAGGGIPATSGAPAGSVDMNANKTTIEGCLVQQGSDFYIEPTHNGKAMVHVVPKSAEDFMSYVGHKVKVHGISQMAANRVAEANEPVAGKKTNITERDLASAAQGTNVPNSLTTPDQNPPKTNDAMVGSGALPQGSEVKVPANGSDFIVSKIDNVSNTCSTKAMKHEKGSSSETTPPPR